jgi:hypothetical protein
MTYWKLLLPIEEHFTELDVPMDVCCEAIKYRLVLQEIDVRNAIERLPICKLDNLPLGFWRNVGFE